MINLFLKLSISFFLIAFLPKNSYSQNLSEQQLDLLKQKATTCDSIGLNAMSELIAFYYYHAKKTNQRYFIQKLIDCSKSRDDKYTLIEGYSELFVYHQVFSEGIDSTLATADKIFSLIKNDTSTKSAKLRIQTSLTVGAHYYEKMDDPETANSYYQEAIKQSLQKKFYDLYLASYQGMVIYYLYDQQYEEAIQLGNEALANIPNPKLATNQPLLANTNLNALKFYQDNISYYKASAILLEPSRDSTQKMEAYQELVGYLKSYEGQPNYQLMTISLIIETMQDHLPLDTLLQYGKRGMELEAILDYSDHNLNRHHGKSLMKAKRYHEAKNILTNALELAKVEKDWFHELADTYDALAQVNFKLGNIKEAQENFDSYKIFIDSTFSRKNRNAVENVETRFALKQQKAENEVISAQADRLSERVKLFAILGLLLFLLAGLALAFYLQQRKNARKLAQLNETKNKIFAILGHDLKGPSMAFNNLTGKLSYLIKKEKIDTLIKLAPSFEESGQRLSRIINDVLNWALTENESYLNNPEKVMVFPIIKQTVEDFENYLTEKNININIQVPQEENILFDKNAFKIINRNLIHNAIKFSPNDSTINIRYNKQKNNIEYIDKGMGMDDDTIKNIQKEMPVESSIGTQNERGTGIGLVTCLKLAKLNKGNLSFSKNAPSGTIVEFDFSKAELN